MAIRVYNKYTCLDIYDKLEKSGNGIPSIRIEYLFPDDIIEIYVDDIFAAFNAGKRRFNKNMNEEERKAFRQRNNECWDFLTRLLEDTYEPARKPGGLQEINLNSRLTTTVKKIRDAFGLDIYADDQILSDEEIKSINQKRVAYHRFLRNLTKKEFFHMECWDFLFDDNDMELRFNPYHDPINGQFISGTTDFSGICLVIAGDNLEYAEYDGKYVKVEKGKIVEVLENYESEKQKIADSTEREIIESYTTRAVTYLSESNRKKVMEETGWPDIIIDYIEDMEQYEIYKNAGLHYAVVNGRPCLVKNYIDLDYKHSKKEKKNSKRMKYGDSPFDKNSGTKIILHHMRQEHNAPFVELTTAEHKNIALHKHNDVPSWRNNVYLDKKYNKQKRKHYKERFKNENIS